MKCTLLVANLADIFSEIKTMCMLFINFYSTLTVTVYVFAIYLITYIMHFRYLLFMKIL